MPFELLLASAMLMVGVIEVVAGLLVLWRPRIGAYVVALWLAAMGGTRALHAFVVDAIWTNLHYPNFIKQTGLGAERTRAIAERVMACAGIVTKAVSHRAG